MTDKQRIEHLLGILHLNAKQFAESIGMKRVDTIYNIMHGKHGITKEKRTTNWDENAIGRPYIRKGS